VKWAKIASLSGFIILFNLFYSCKDIVFNNPLDPNASKAVLDVIRVLETDLSGPGDIGFDGEKFWKINSFGNLTAFDRESGIVIRTFSSEPGTGIAFLRDKIYLCNGIGENVLVSVDPLSGDVINRASTREIQPAFLTAANNRLVVFDLRSSGIFEYDPETGTSSRLFEVSGLNIGGIATYKGGLLITDMNTDSLYRFTFGGDVTDVFTSPASGLGGVAVDTSSYVYLLMLDGKVYKVSLP
jgi:outer membrane protein assembly factor BamB